MALISAIHADFPMIEASKVIFLNGKDQLQENFPCRGDLMIKMKLVITIYIL